MAGQRQCRAHAEAAVAFLACPFPLLQIQYRSGNNKEAIVLYSQLFRSHGAESREVQTNVLAAYVAGGQAGEVPAVMEAMKVGARLPQFHLCVQWEFGAWGVWVSCLQVAADSGPSAAPCLQISAKDSFEVAFNAACGLVETGSLQKAEEQLQLAVRVGEYGRFICRALRALGECPAMQCCATLAPSAGLNLD